MKTILVTLVILFAKTCFSQAVMLKCSHFKVPEIGEYVQNMSIIIVDGNDMYIDMGASEIIILKNLYPVYLSKGFTMFETYGGNSRSIITFAHVAAGISKVEITNKRGTCTFLCTEPIRIEKDGN